MTCGAAAGTQAGTQRVAGTQGWHPDPPPKIQDGTWIFRQGGTGHPHRTSRRAKPHEGANHPASTRERAKLTHALPAHTPLRAHPASTDALVSVQNPSGHSLQACTTVHEHPHPHEHRATPLCNAPHLAATSTHAACEGAHPSLHTPVSTPHGHEHAKPLSAHPAGMPTLSRSVPVHGGRPTARWVPHNLVGSPQADRDPRGTRTPR